MFRTPEFRQQVTIGVVVTVLTLILIQPILNLCGRLLNLLGATLSDGFSRFLYTSAALGMRDENSFVLLITIAGFSSGLISAATIGPWLSRSSSDSSHVAQSRR